VVCASHCGKGILREMRPSDFKVEKLRLMNLKFRTSFSICVTDCNVEIDLMNLLCSRILCLKSKQN
jgi:hypothetical protein